MAKKILFILVLSLFFIQCDDSGKKKVVPPFSSQDQQQGTLLVDDTGKVIVSDGTVPAGESLPVVTQDTGSSSSSSGSQSTTLLNQGTDNSGDNSGTQSNQGSSQQTTSQSSSSGGDNTGTTGSSGSGDSNTTGSNPQPPQVPDVEPVDNLTQDNSEFAKYDIHSSAGVYWIKDLVQDGTAVFGWEFPPSFTIKIESIDPDAKVFVTMYGVYPSKETDVFYQYMVTQNPSDCKDDGEHHKHKKDKKDHDDHGDSDHHGDKDGKVDDDHHGDGGGGNEADDNKNKDGDKDQKHHGHDKDHKHNRCAMRDIQVDGSKWVIMGGKGYKYGYIEFHVLDANGNDITSTTKAKINVNINGTALTAFLTKIKVHPTPAFIAVTLLLLGIIVGINVLRRRMA